MLENIVRHLEMGKPPHAGGARRRRAEVGFTILSMTFSLAAVFIPVLFMGGIVGRLFHEFAVTIGVAILVSGFVSLTLTPMLCSRFLQRAGTEAHGAHRTRCTGRTFDGLLDAMLARRSTCAWALRIAAARCCCSRSRSSPAPACSSSCMPKGFLPSEDTGQTVSRPPRRRRTCRSTGWSTHQQQVAEIVRQDPNVGRVMSVRRRRRLDASASNSGRLFIALKPRERAARTADEVDRRAADRSWRGAGHQACTSRTRRRSASAGARRRACTSTRCRGRTSTELYDRGADSSRRGCGRCPSSSDVTSDLLIRSPQVNVDIDRDRAAALGVSAPADRERALRTPTGRGRCRPSTRRPTSTGSCMELRAASSSATRRARRGCTSARHRRARAARLRRDAQTDGVGPLTVNHLGQLPSVTISFNLRRACRSATALGDGRAATARDAAAGDGHTAASRARRRRSSRRGRAWACCSSLAVFVIYLVLGMLYESFIHPITILSGLPFAAFGALLTLLTLPERPQRLRVRRHHHADRHREEERDHDDRLRARRASAPRAERRRTRSTRRAWCASGRS